MNIFPLLNSKTVDTLLKVAKEQVCIAQFLALLEYSLDRMLIEFLWLLKKKGSVLLNEYCALNITNESRSTLKEHNIQIC